MGQAAPETPQPDPNPFLDRSSLAAMGLSALGIVFGDIGTSPLYTFKTVLNLTGGTPTPDIILGVLSLIIWSLIIVTSVKYVTVAMSIGNDGEGGILALMALLGIKKHQRPAIVAVGLFGAALIYGDGAITPAISVLSALEGLEHRDPRIEILRPAGGSRYSCSPLRDPAPGHIANRQGLRPDHGFLVFVNRGARHMGGHAASGGVCRLESPLRASLPVFQRLRELPCSGRCLPLRDRGRGVTVCLTLFFGKSDNLAAAYGIAVSATMLMTSALLFIAMREVWGWGLLASGAIAGAFLCVDASFFLANLVKVADGGYVPLLLASIVYGVMLIWHRGSTTVAQVLSERAIPVSEFMDFIEFRRIPRVPGTAVFLTRTLSDTPPVVVWHVKHNRALHDHLFALRVVTESIPRIKEF